MARSGLHRRGWASHGRIGTPRSGKARPEAPGHGRHSNPAWLGLAGGHGWARLRQRKARLAAARSGRAGRRAVWHGRLGSPRLGAACRRRAWRGKARDGLAWIGTAGNARQARQGTPRTGPARKGTARPGPARQGADRPGTAGSLTSPRLGIPSGRGPRRRGPLSPMASPTSRTLQLLRKHGWEADVVERWINIPGHPAGGIRRDLFGFADILAARHFPEPAILAIQCTSQTNAASRVRKIHAEPRAAVWLLAGGQIEVWGWRKLKKPPPGANPRQQWFPRIVRVTEGLDPETASWQDWAG